MTVKGEPELMRRAAYIAHIRPSQINAWRAGRREGQQFTDRQMAAMALYDLDPATCEVVEVYSPATRDEMWWGMRTPTPIFVLECPILARRTDGRLLVIAPAGINKIVNADGSIRKRTR